MDEAEENFDVSAATEAPGADGDSLPNLQSFDLESGSDFNLDALLDAAGTEKAASAEGVLGNGAEDADAASNAVDEEGSTADLNMDAWLAGEGSSAEDVSEENSFAPEVAEADLNMPDEPAIWETEEGGALPTAESEAGGGTFWLNAADEAEQPAVEADFSEENSLAGENPSFETETPSFAEIAGAEENAFPLSGIETAAIATVVNAAASGCTAAESNANFVKWYSGSVHDEMFEISKNDLPETISGDAVRRIVHVNAGYDSYGWLAEFDNGLTMSLEDVRKYQIRNGVLPSSNGVIRYGQSRCAFSGIERILIYRSVRYFSYGV